MYKPYLILIFTFITWLVFSQQENISLEDSLLEFKKYEIPHVEVISKRNRIMGDIPGSVTYIKGIELKNLAALSSNEVFRKVPGLHVVDEEGSGLRMNLGIRGLDPDRSRNVLVLEDGIPVALGPYSEPELYYTPSIDKMNGVEVLKGSGQILFGPQTIGGVVNYLTSDPPDSTKSRIKLIIGQNGLLSSLLSFGTSKKNFGIQTSYLHKRAHRIAYSGFRIHDVTTKIKLYFNSKSQLGIKLSIYDEWSDATYIGLTQSMYVAGDMDYVKMASSDQLSLRRYAASVNHDFKINSKIQFNTTAFANTTTRNWQRQDFASSSTVSNQTGIIWGDTSILGGAIFMRNTNAHRDRSFEVVGFEPKLLFNYSILDNDSKLQVGLRYLYERAFEQRKNGASYNALSGALVEDEIRTGQSISIYIHNKLELTKKLFITAGVRSEYFNYSRNILRNTFIINQQNLLRDTNIIANNQISVIIPGIGLNYNVAHSTSIFVGIHRGFAPPRIKDAISVQGEVYALNAEKSWNSELGLRSRWKEIFECEFTLFHMDFSNQIIPVSQSSGGLGVGLINGGKTIHQGIELACLWNFSKYFNSAYNFSIKSNATLVNAMFVDDRFIGNDKININGNSTPYAPSYILNSSFILEMPIGVGIQCTGNFTGSQYSDELNTLDPSEDGRIGKINSYSVWDLNLFYNNSNKNFNINISIKNISNERYIVTRRPQGIRLGIPRFISVGLEKYF